MPRVHEQYSDDISTDTDVLDPRLDLLKEILAELNACSIGYGLIHGAHRWPDVSSDVDLAFDRNPAPVLDPILRDFQHAGKLIVVQKLHYEVPYGYYYMLRLSGAHPLFLHLDCLFDPFGVNRYHLKTTELLERKSAEDWGYRIGTEQEALYLLVKRVIKREVSLQELEELRCHFHSRSEVLRRQVETWFGSKGAALVEQLLDPERVEESRAVLGRLRGIVETRFRTRHPVRYLAARFLGSMRKAYRFFNPTGLFVVVLGPDGSGKSTISNLILFRLNRAFRRTWRFHWRPNLLPKLRRGLIAGDAEGASIEAPSGISKYRGVVSLARFFYYWLDFVLGYWLVIYPRKAQTTLIIGERYFPDVLVHPQRYGFAVPNWLMRAAARLVPSPDLLILLSDDPAVIYARKPELSPAAIAAQLAGYGSEIKHWGRAVVVQTKGGIDALVVQISDLIVRECSRRTARRMISSGPSPGWRAFPFLASVKVWVNDKDTFSNAFNLYHPYSKLGRLTKSLLHLLPDAVHRRLLQSHPEPEESRHLYSFTRIIRETIGNDNAIASFSSPMLTPRQKLTAQVSDKDKVLCYVKIAKGDKLRERLATERGMLAWLHQVKFEAALLPQVLAFEHADESSLLFLSAPPRPGKQRPLEADEKDAVFLSGLVGLNGKTVPITEVLRRLEWPAFLERVQEADPQSAATLRHAIETIQNTLGPRGTKLAASHGDYGPWNTLEQDGALYVFDWECGEKEAPSLGDVFHRVSMPARLVLKQPPDKIIDRLLNLHHDPILGPVIIRSGVAPAEMPVYLLIYFIREAVREEAEQGKCSDFVIESVRLCLTSADHSENRRKILVAAYACEPGGGSEPGVGWNMCQAISREHETWVITRRNNRGHIEKALAEHPNPHLHFCYADLPYWARFWKRGGKGIRTYYYLWQFAALREALKLKRRVHFDLSHHVTFVNNYVFSFLGLLPIPLVWGPLGSNPKWPASLISDPVTLFMDRVRYWFQVCLRSADPLYWFCAARARLIVGINSQVQQHFPLSVFSRGKFISYTAIGVEKVFPVKHKRSDSDHFHVLSMGRLIPIKAFHISILAFALLLKDQPKARLSIVGDGPDKQTLQKLIAKLGVLGHVEFVNWLPRREALSMMEDADVFLFPSFEGSGMVVLEAMAHGLPVVCLDCGGPGQMVTGECGFVVQVGSMHETVEKLGDALKALAQDQDMRMRMGLAARERVRERYLWDSRHEAIKGWYAAALAKQAQI